MAIHFDGERMARALETYEAWWKGELDRPLVSVTVPDAHPAPKRTPAPVLAQRTCHEMDWSAEEMIEALDEELSRREYLGDAFPWVDFAAFGPGVLAAMCGAKLDNSSGGVWFFPDREREIEDIHIRYDPDNLWARRIKDLYRAGLKKWQGSVILGFPDLGGVLDVAATFCGSENLLLDLYDAPQEVLRLAREAQQAWYAAFDDCAQALAPQGGFTHWSGLLSRNPSYIPQCDFCYMIGNPMFRRFVLPTLQEDARRLEHSIYHLDGVGQLNHLDDILAIPELDAVQWVYGDGQPGAGHWLDVYRRIQAAGKRMWVVGGPQDYLDVVQELHGSPYSSHSIPASQDALIRRVLAAR